MRKRKSAIALTLVAALALIVHESEVC